MRQRVMIALALACGPRLLFADEPTTALDVTVQAEILNLLQDNQADRFMAMVLVTHDLGVVAGRTDEIAVMYAGKIVEQARTSVLFGEDAAPLHRGPAALDPDASRIRATPACARSSAGRRTSWYRRPGCSFAPRCPYAQDRCRAEAPVLELTGSTGHRFACFYPLGTPENAAALQHNLSAGLPQAIALLDSPGGAPIDLDLAATLGGAAERTGGR